jgi:hypothetical protein
MWSNDWAVQRISREAGVEYRESSKVILLSDKVERFVLPECDFDKLDKRNLEGEESGLRTNFITDQQGWNIFTDHDSFQRTGKIR